MDDADRTQMISEVYEAAAMRAHHARTCPPPAEVARFKRAGGGICADCRRPIAQARIKAHPHATRCIKCQTEFENGGNA